MNVKQRLLAINTRLCGLMEGVPGAVEQRAVRRDKSLPGRPAPPPAIATATFAPAPWGRWQGRQHQALRRQIGALPTRLPPAWSPITKTPGRRGGHELPVPPPQAAGTAAGRAVRSGDAHTFLSNDDVFPQTVYRRFSHRKNVFPVIFKHVRS